jgi:hypothetical protein
MANNRLFIEDTETGEQFLLAKGFGDLWSPVGNLTDKLDEWLNTGDRDRAASNHGATKLRLVTEDTRRSPSWRTTPHRLR